MHAKFENVRWKPLLGARFSKITSTDAKGNEWLRAQDGFLSCRWDGEGFGQHLFLSELSLSSDFLRPLSLMLQAKSIHLDNETLHFNKSFFYFNRSGSLQRLRILKMRSPVLELRGRLEWDNGHLKRASLAAWIPAALAKQLPDHWDRRLTTAAGDKKIIKCAYKNNHLTFYGRFGPLLRAAWSTD